MVAVLLVLAASALAGCQQPLGTTVGGEPCSRDLHASPRSVHPGAQLTLRRAAGCDPDHAHRLTVSLTAALHESSDCDDTSSCAGHPTWTWVRVR